MKINLKYLRDIGIHSRSACFERRNFYRWFKKRFGEKNITITQRVILEYFLYWRKDIDLECCDMESKNDYHILKFERILSYFLALVINPQTGTHGYMGNSIKVETIIYRQDSIKSLILAFLNLLKGKRRKKNEL
jgi:hypothetical protein